MHGYYCKKCKRDSASPVCQYCGVQIASLHQNERFFWKMLRIPLGDTVTVIIYRGGYQYEVDIILGESVS